MKKLFLILMLCIALVFNINCKTNAQATGFLDEATKNKMSDLLNGGITLIIYQNGSVDFSQERGIAPLFKMVENKKIKNAYAFDKVVGRAAAFLYAKGEADYVFAQTMSIPATKILRKYGIKYDAKTITKEIVNRKNTGLCPFEELVKNSTNADTAYNLIKKELNNK